MNLDNINTVEELITAWRTYGYKVECIVVRAGSESIYYIGVDDDNCTVSLSTALFELSEKLQKNLTYYLEYPEKFSSIRQEVMQIA